MRCSSAAPSRLVTRQNACSWGASVTQETGAPSQVRPVSLPALAPYWDAGTVHFHRQIAGVMRA